MNASELRIGNLVYGYPFRIINVGEITKKCVLIKHDETEEPFNYDELEGIPLTPEILEKAGFQYQADINNGYYELDSFSLDETDGGFLHNACDNSVDYLHQLQNLYFALTGSELEIQLTSLSLK
jgi:hypothetical protein